MTGNTLLHRQVNPNWVQQGRVTSQVFRPMPKDAGLLSVYDGDLITAQNAWRHFTGVLGFSSVGVLAVSVSECAAQALTARSDPDRFPEHAVVDFSGLDRSSIESKAKTLRCNAEQRGWQYQSEGAR